MLVTVFFLSSFALMFPAKSTSNTPLLDMRPKDLTTELWLPKLGFHCGFQFKHIPLRPFARYHANFSVGIWKDVCLIIWHTACTFLDSYLTIDIEFLLASFSSFLYLKFKIYTQLLYLIPNAFSDTDHCGNWKLWTMDASLQPALSCVGLSCNSIMVISLWVFRAYTTPYVI